MAEDNCPECPDCPPADPCKAGAPEWMATFSDLVTLLLTFFVLLYAMSKTDESKFQSVAGSIRKAFAGNAMKIGETIQLGKSPDDSPTMIESEQPVEPYPIDLLTTEGILDKYEINRESDEDIKEMSEVLKANDLVESAEMYQMAEGIKIRIKDKIFFKEGSTAMSNSDIVPVFKKLINLMKDNDWTLFIEGYAEAGEKWNKDPSSDAWDLSYKRAIEVTRSLVKRGVRPEKITTVFYGDSRAIKGDLNRKVEFILRKRDLKTEGRRVTPK
jgi:chemotaxis protein MotB